MGCGSSSAVEADNNQQKQPVYEYKPIQNNIQEINVQQNETVERKNPYSQNKQKNKNYQNVQNYTKKQDNNNNLNNQNQFEVKLFNNNDIMNNFVPKNSNNNGQNQVFVFSTSNVFPNQNCQIDFNNMNNPFMMINQKNQSNLKESLGDMPESFNQMFKMFKDMQNQNMQVFQSNNQFSSSVTYKTSIQNNPNNNQQDEEEEDNLTEVSGEVSTNIYDPKRIYKAIIDLRSEYPQGRPWTNDQKYDWVGEKLNPLGYGQYNGRGCMAFGMLASDAAFGNRPIYKFTDRKNIRVGDVLRIKNDTHTVIVLKKLGGTRYKIAEGNFNKSINWGRIIDLDETGFDYGFTRYNN